MGVLIFGCSPVKRAAGIKSHLQNLIQVFKALRSLLFETVLTVITLPVEIVEGQSVRFFKLSTAFDWLRLGFATPKREGRSP